MYRWDDRHDCIESHRTRQNYPILLVKLVLHFHPNSFGFDIDFDLNMHHLDSIATTTYYNYS